MAVTTQREPRRRLGASTNEGKKSQKGSLRKRGVGTLFQRHLQRPPMGKGGHRILPTADWGKSTTIQEESEAPKKEENHEATAREGGEKKKLFQLLKFSSNKFKTFGDNMTPRPRSLLSKTMSSQVLKKTKKNYTNP